jgi:hypothetical protein
MRSDWPARLETVPDELTPLERLLAAKQAEKQAQRKRGYLG